MARLTANFSWLAACVSIAAGLSLVINRRAAKDSPPPSILPKDNGR